jgi:6,7-dimethyl-8-ribityllumazine synthase
MTPCSPVQRFFSTETQSSKRILVFPLSLCPSTTVFEQCTIKIAPPQAIQALSVKITRMPKQLETSQNAEGIRFAVIVSQYNSFITDRLLNGALEALQSHGADVESILVIRVPGSFEIPQAARKIAETVEYDAIICLGALLRGETLHFELISAECARGIQDVASEFGLPVTFGVITADTTEQALERAGERSQNKGWESALAAIEMANLFRKIADFRS